MSLARHRAEKRARSRHASRFWNEHDKATYRCPVCGRGEQLVRRFEVHHVDGNPLNGDDENLIALCWWCHLQAHGKIQRTLSTEEWCNGFLTLGTRDSRTEVALPDGGEGEKWWGGVMDDA